MELEQMLILRDQLTELEEQLDDYENEGTPLALTPNGGDIESVVVLGIQNAVSSVGVDDIETIQLVLNLAIHRLDDMIASLMIDDVNKAID